jgi:hypothetical protein
VRIHQLIFVNLLLLAALGNASAALKSTPVAVALGARVEAVLELQAGEPEATSGSALIVSAGQDGTTVVFTPAGGQAAWIEIPVLIKTNVNDVLFRAACECGSSAYVSLNSTAGKLFVSRPMPLGPDVVFALASGLIGNSEIAFGAPVLAMISIAVPPGLPESQPITIKLTIESLRK